MKRTIEIDEDLAMNLMADFGKSDINSYQKGKHCIALIKSKAISQRILSQKTGIPHTNIQRWCQFTKIPEEEYYELLAKNWTDKGIFQYITKANDGNQINDKPFTIDKALEFSIRLIRPLIKRENFSNHTRDLVIELRDILNRMEMYRENQINGKKSY